VIIWLNGTFGAGKTTTAHQLVGALPEVRLFDPEYVGYMVAEHLRDHEFTDFQQLEPWRTLVPTVMAEVIRFTSQGLVAPQSVLVSAYWQELRDGFVDCSLDVFHVLLDADFDVLRARIDADQVELPARGWRLAHLAEYAAARDWMVDAADLVVDTTTLTPPEVAAAIQAAVSRWPGSSDAPSRLR
jgi:adenylylsulfate kinase-like enzyme